MMKFGKYFPLLVIVLAGTGTPFVAIVLGEMSILVRKKTLFIILLSLTLSSCAVTKKAITPPYMENKPIWLKVAFWAGPGH